MDWIDKIQSQEYQQGEVMSFNDYMNTVEKTPRRELRTTTLYLKEMFDFYGRSEDGGFNLFKKHTAEAPAVYGQINTQKLIYRNLCNFIEEGYNNKFLLLVGPNGSSKSSIIKKIMLAAQEYSQSEEGALYTFSWIFPIDTYTKGSLGLASTEKGRQLESFSMLDDKEINAILNAELKDHPLMLIPIDARREMIERLLEDFPKELESIKKSYLYNGDLSKRNRMIFDALLKNYKGNILEVYRHIRVERFFINKKHSIGATTIEPQLHVDARLQQITMDKRLASLPPSLQSLNLFSMNGEIILANRGILEFSDLLKRPLDTFKYLLVTMESRSINLQGILTELDIFFMGSSNEVHFTAFKQHPDYNSFKGRFNFIKVPYLLNFTEEEKIYGEQISNIKEFCRFEPYALTALALWATMTRLRAPQAKNYKDPKLGVLVERLNPIQKALFIAYHETPEDFKSEEKQTLQRGYREIVKEFLFDTLYEGKFGISPREIKQIIYELSSQHDTVTFVEIIEHLKILCDKKIEYDFLNISPQRDFHNAQKFISLVEDYCLNVFDSEVRESLGLVDERSYEDYIGKYILHVSAHIKGEKIKNKVTGKFEPSDMYFIKEFETNINLQENPENFRSHTISKLGAYSLDHPGQPIKYMEVFDDMARSLQESFRNEQRKVINKVAKSLVFYLQELSHTNEQGEVGTQSLNRDSREQIEKIISTLCDKFKYSKKGAINVLEYLLKKRY